MEAAVVRVMMFGWILLSLEGCDGSLTTCDAYGLGNGKTHPAPTSYKIKVGLLQNARTLKQHDEIYLWLFVS